MVTLTTKFIEIPQIEEDRLNELAARIKPVITFDGARHYIVPCDLRSEAYVWSPQKAKIAPPLVELVDIRTYHTFAYYGFFKPSIAEVLAQIPADIIDHVTEFEIINSPIGTADLNDESAAVRKGFHVATTRLYARG